MKISNSNIEQLVIDTLHKVTTHVEEMDFPLSSEKTLVFKFMWELSKIVSNNDLKFDFEYTAYPDSSDSKFLDLLVWTDDNYKVAFEFKLPKCGTSNSNQPERKKQIYNDIARVRCLVYNSQFNIQAGFFICAINEEAYLYQRNADLQYSISHKHLTVVTEFDGMKLPENLVFLWNRIKWSERYSKWVCDGKFAWLELIKIIRKV